MGPFPIARSLLLPVVSLPALLLFPAGCVFVLDGDGHWVHEHSRHRDTVQGSGVSKSDTRTVGDFHRIVVDGSPDLDVRIGETQSVHVTGDDNLVDWVTTEAVDGVLRVGTRSGSYSTRLGLKLFVTVPALDAVEVRGSSDVDVKGVSGESFAVTVQGSGDVHGTGKVQKLAASVSGSGDLALAGIEAAEARVSVAGSGDVDVWATGSLTVSIAGSGDVSYRGDPSITKSIAGSGGLSKR